MSKNWWELRKGTGVIVCIPGDEHNGVQSKRPGIVLKNHSKYITVHLLSTTKSNHDIGMININYKIQYVRTIYLKNILPNQIIGLWYDYKKNPIVIPEENKLMKMIESNPYKATSITLSLSEHLAIQENYKNTLKENEQLKKQIELLQNNKLKNRNRG